MADYQRLTHEFEPVYNDDSKILILGTFPSVKSREHHFYYGHPQNRFWKVLAAIMKEPVPANIPEKKQLLLKHRIAIWDVIQSCEIIGSSDSSIRNVVPADIPGLLKQSSICAVFGNGRKTCELFETYTRPTLLADFSDNQQKTEALACIHKLPSTSPANAAWNLQRLVEDWEQKILPFL
ncbi:DNA-deoxyinosine glycosylase [Lachnospiraceae bacterium 3-1]|nr:DNA-deoxyinosine glycosylase [Lachnospiraceae bacterium 3-1]